MSIPLFISIVIALAIVILGIWSKKKKPYSSYGFVWVVLLFASLVIGGYSYYNYFPKKTVEPAPTVPKPANKKSGSDSYVLDSRMFNKIVNGQDVWEILYYPDQQPHPGWIGPCGLKEGQYELAVLADYTGTLRARVNNGEHFPVRHAQVIKVPSNSCLSVYSDRGSLIGIVIKRLGNTSGSEE
jgi:hypothetical protein